MSHLFWPSWTACKKSTSIFLLYDKLFKDLLTGHSYSVIPLKRSVLYSLVFAKDVHDKDLYWSSSFRLTGKGRKWQSKNVKNSGLMLQSRGGTSSVKGAAMVFLGNWIQCAFLAIMCGISLKFSFTRVELHFALHPWIDPSEILAF